MNYLFGCSQCEVYKSEVAMLRKLHIKNESKNTRREDLRRNMKSTKQTLNKIWHMVRDIKNKQAALHEPKLLPTGSRDHDEYTDEDVAFIINKAEQSSSPFYNNESVIVETVINKNNDTF
jgi:esterase/lipase